MRKQAENSWVFWQKSHKQGCQQVGLFPEPCLYTQTLDKIQTTNVMSHTVLASSVLEGPEGHLQCGDFSAAPALCERLAVQQKEAPWFSPQVWDSEGQGGRSLLYLLGIVAGYRVVDFVCLWKKIKNITEKCKHRSVKVGATMTNLLKKGTSILSLPSDSPCSHLVPCIRRAIYWALSGKLNKDWYQRQILSTSMLQNLVTVQNGPRKINKPGNDGVCKYWCGRWAQGSLMKQKRLSDCKFLCPDWVRRGLVTST